MEIFEFLKDFSWEVLAISFIVFALTMIIKLPIKKATAKLAENKRKAINSVIILIPIILSFVTTTLFFGIVNDVWFSFNIVETSVSSCLLAISIYAIFQRIVILIKGFISGKITIKDSQVQETISSLKENIKTLTSNINKDESALKQLSEKISCLLNIKKEIECSTDLIDLNKLSETNTQIQALTNEEIKLEEKIINAKNELNEYKLKLSQENTTKSVS